jgi:hypothetical protein
MYTDWGNLKIVSRRAWFQGLDPAAQRSAGGMDALGASIFTLKRNGDPSAVKAGWALTTRLGDAEILGYSRVCF